MTHCSRTCTQVYIETLKKKPNSIVQLDDEITISTIKLFVSTPQYSLDSSWRETLLKCDT